MYRLYVKSLRRETLEIVTDARRRLFKLCNAFFVPFISMYVI